MKLTTYEHLALSNQQQREAGQWLRRVAWGFVLWAAITLACVCGHSVVSAQMPGLELDTVHMPYVGKEGTP